MVIPRTNVIDVSKTSNCVSGVGEKALFSQFKAALSQNPAVAKLSDLQKQQYTELLAVITNMTFSAYGEGLKRGDRSLTERARQGVRQNLERLFGAAAGMITINDEGHYFKKVERVARPRDEG